MTRLNMQLPKASPMAMFGASATVTALIPVNNSGSDVAVASMISPTQEADIPVSRAIA